MVRGGLGCGLPLSDDAGKDALECVCRPSACCNLRYKYCILNPSKPLQTDLDLGSIPLGWLDLKDLGRRILGSCINPVLSRSLSSSLALQQCTMASYLRDTSPMV